SRWSRPVGFHSWRAVPRCPWTPGSRRPPAGGASFPVPGESPLWLGSQSLEARYRSCTISSFQGLIIFQQDSDCPVADGDAADAIVEQHLLQFLHGSPPLKQPLEA